MDGHADKFRGAAMTFSEGLHARFTAKEKGPKEKDRNNKDPMAIA